MFNNVMACSMAGLVGMVEGFAVVDCVCSYIRMYVCDTVLVSTGLRLLLASLCMSFSACMTEQASQV